MHQCRKKKTLFLVATSFTISVYKKTLVCVPSNHYTTDCPMLLQKPGRLLALAFYVIYRNLLPSTITCFFLNTKKVEPPSFLLRKKKSSNEDEWGDAVPLFLVVVCVCWNLGWFGRLLMPLLYFCLTVLRQEDLPAYLVPWLMTMLQNTFCSILSRVIHSTWREKTRGGKHWLLTELLRAWQKLAETLQKL